MTVMLEGGEADLVAELLRQRLRDLQEEVIHTDTRNYRAWLRDEEAVVQRLLEKLSAGPVERPGSGPPPR